MTLVSDGYVFSSTSVAGGALIQPLRKNGGFTAQELYFDNKLRFDLGNVVKVGDYLYGTPGASVMCVEFKTGAIKWQERSKSLSFLYANGRLYTHAEDGYVLQALQTMGEHLDPGRRRGIRGAERETAGLTRSAGLYRAVLELSWGVSHDWSVLGNVGVADTNRGVLAGGQRQAFIGFRWSATGSL